MEKERKVSMKAKGNTLAAANKQIEILERSAEKIPSFKDRLNNIGLYPLKPTSIEILQINMGYMCNQTCEHCHVDAGPDRKEITDQTTLNACLNAIDQCDSIHTVDLTGGAPEMNPHFRWFVEEVSKRNVKVIVRCNLTIITANKKYHDLPEFFKQHHVEVIASLPCYTESNTDKQRGSGVFNSSIEGLQRLNKVGYGAEGSGLHLHLVFNPGGPSIAPSQEALEGDYKRILKADHDIIFNNLYTITNLPISRFLDYLIAAGRYDEYMMKLSEAFNPSAAAGVMCRNTLSVDWEGNLYDCDFNQMLKLKTHASAPKTIFDFQQAKLENREIIINEHCYGCTAGAGSSCQGALT